MSETKVLIVDDEPEFLESMSERMTNRGFTVKTAATGMEALDRLEEQKYDAIVLDMMMPGLDGMATLKRIRADHPEMQVILLTGHATVKQGVEAIKLGAIDFLEKPANLDELSQKIEEAKSNRLLLVESRQEESIKDTLTRMGW